MEELTATRMSGSDRDMSTMTPSTSGKSSTGCICGNRRRSASGKRPLSGTCGPRPLSTRRDGLSSQGNSSSNTSSDNMLLEGQLGHVQAKQQQAFTDRQARQTAVIEDAANAARDTMIQRFSGPGEGTTLAAATIAPTCPAAAAIVPTGYPAAAPPAGLPAAASAAATPATGTGHTSPISGAGS